MTPTNSPTTFAPRVAGNVEPHANIEDAEHQSPDALRDVQNDVPDEALVPENPPAADLVQAETRLHRMLDTALDRSGGLRGMSGKLYDAIKAEVPRPKLFHSGFRIHASMTDAAKACDAAAANLRGIPVADFRQSPLPDAAFTALKRFVDAQNKLYTQITAFREKSGVTIALLDSLAQATQFRASEALNFVAVMQLSAISPERRQELAPGIREPQGDTAGHAMQGMAHDMHGSREIAGKFKNDAAQLFGRIDTLEGRMGQMPIAEFGDTIAGLRADLEALRVRVNGAMSLSRTVPFSTPSKGCLSDPPSGWKTLLQPTPKRGSNLP